MIGWSARSADLCIYSSDTFYKLFFSRQLFIYLICTTERNTTTVTAGLVARHWCRSKINTSSSISNSQMLYIILCNTWLLTSGMNPPWRMPNKARVARNDARPLNLNWLAATTLHRIIWQGINLSGPILSLISMLGIQIESYLPFWHELGRQLGRHERYGEYSVSKIVI